MKTSSRSVAAAWLLVTVCCLLMASAGFAQKVPKNSVTTDSKADFSRYKTYAWGESKFKAKQDVYHQIIVAAIESQLSAKGLSKAEGEPDLRVIYHADVDVPESGAEGVIIAQGGNTNGWSLYAKGGKLKYCYNFFGVTLTFVEATKPIPAGNHQVRMEFKYDGGGLAKGGDVTLYVDGKKVGNGRLEQTVPMAYSADETCDVGKEGGSPVSPDYGPTGNEFSGEVNWVQIDLEGEDHDHLVSPEERYRVAMARQ